MDDVGNLVIARILGGGTAARQGLLRIGEIVLEVNGKDVHTPDELQQAIHEAKDNLTLKLGPGLANDGSRPLKSTVFIILYNSSRFKTQSDSRHDTDFLTSSVLHASLVRLRPIRRHAATMQRDRAALPEGRHTADSGSS